jgi:dihydropyrimidinase
MRLPVLFDAMVSKGRLGLKKFVELTSTAPAQIYDLPGKGSLAIGLDADIAIWDADRKVVLADNLHDNTGYNPFAGRTITGWPETVLRRGEVVVTQGTLKAQPGSGRLMLREAGEATRPTGTLSPEFDPARNFGAKLY